MSIRPAKRTRDVDAQFPGELLQLRAAFAVADQQQTGIFDVGERAQQHVEALEVAQSADGEDADVPRWGAEG